jgi:hypothetical protein
MDKEGSKYLKCGRCQTSGDCFEVLGPKLAFPKPTNACQIGHVAVKAQKELHEALVAYYAADKPAEATGGSGTSRSLLLWACLGSISLC